MTFTPASFSRDGLFGHLRTRDWRTLIRCRGMLLRVEVGRIVTDYRGGRAYTRGWYARIIGRGRTTAEMIAYYQRVDEVFGADGLGTRGYGRTREEAVGFLRTALRRGWLASGALYAPAQFDASYTSEYDL